MDTEKIEEETSQEEPLAEPTLKETLNEEPEMEPAEEPVEEPSETPTEQEHAPQLDPDKDDLELFKSVREEVGEKRFDGLMSSWQKDRRELLELKEKPQPKAELEEPPKNAGDDAWLEYLDKKLEQKRTDRVRTEEEATKKEMDALLIEFPNLSVEKIANVAAEYSEEGKGMIPFRTAAKILSNLEKNQESTKALAAEEAKKKKLTGGIAGKAGAEAPVGLRRYDAKKDAGKSFDQLVEEAKKEM